MDRKRIGLIMLLAAPAFLGGGARLSRPPHVVVAQEVQNWQVQVGAQSPDRAVQVLQNYPSALVLNVGDTITWTNPTPEIHTVTFLAPDQERPRFNRADPLQSQPQGNGQIDGTSYLNSGILENGQAFTALAAQPGAYEYICLVHHLQVSSVVVNPAGTPYQQTPQEQAATVTAAEPVITHWQGRMAAYQPQVRRREDGTNEHVISGGMGDGIGATMRFLPQAVQIHVGDTITWDNEDTETPHTVTFGPPAGAPMMPWGNPQAFDGASPLNSGYFGVARPQGQTYSVTFTSPGEFSYVCLLHTGALMLGTVTVTGS